ncbi:hypothetical protein DFH09DRAFT_1069188 [Mycena vulgaris]|nr:hypothetical protein DFH09DRAFT_1069188 [Mycena vulgaris]
MKSGCSATSREDKTSVTRRAITSARGPQRPYRSRELDPNGLGAVHDVWGKVRPTQPGCEEGEERKIEAHTWKRGRGRKFVSVWHCSARRRRGTRCCQTSAQCRGAGGRVTHIKRVGRAGGPARPTGTQRISLPRQGISYVLRRPPAFLHHIPQYPISHTRPRSARDARQSDPTCIRLTAPVASKDPAQRRRHSRARNGVIFAMCARVCLKVRANGGFLCAPVPRASSSATSSCRARRATQSSSSTASTRAWGADARSGIESVQYIREGGEVEWRMGGDGHVTEEISPDCRAIFSDNLGQALLEAAACAKNAIPAENSQTLQGISGPNDEKHTLERVSDFLESLGYKIGTEFEPGKGGSAAQGLKEALPKLDGAPKTFSGGVGRSGDVVEPRLYFYARFSLRL